jgi:hypothetical protein
MWNEDEGTPLGIGSGKGAEGDGIWGKEGKEKGIKA